MPCAAPAPASRRMPVLALWRNALDPRRCGSHSGCPRLPSTSAATAGSGRLGACDLFVEIVRRRSHQKWQRGRLTDGISPDKTGATWSHQPTFDALSAYCHFVQHHLACRALLYNLSTEMSIRGWHRIAAAQDQPGATGSEVVIRRMLCAPCCQPLGLWCRRGSWLNVLDFAGFGIDS